MNDNIESTRKYAVVKFKLDSSYSEIPVTWLMERTANGQWCLWPPRTVNCAILINNYATPNYDTWVRHEVDFIKYCSSLESARKNAADSNYQTIDEERLGRGKRQHVPCTRYSSEEEECESSQSRKHNKIRRKQCDANIVSMPPSCPNNFTMHNSNNNSNNSNVRKQTYDESAQNATSSPEHVSEEEENNFSMDENIDIRNVPVIFEEYNVNDAASTSTQNKEDLNIKQNKKMLRMMAAIHITLRDINQRLNRTSLKNRAINVVENNDAFIAQFLPLTTINTIKEFDNLLKTTDEAVTQFKELLSKIGGNNSRDSIYRTLKKIFTDECAMNCSWKGLRNNFRIVDLCMTKLMRREIMLRNISLTESQFDHIAAEWLRFAKQRKQRFDKAMGNEEDNRID